MEDPIEVAEVTGKAGHKDEDLEKESQERVDREDEQYR